MRLLFVDEFKDCSNKEYNFYGLVFAVINNSSYARFKNGFYQKLHKLGWDVNKEIKGRFSYSAKKGDPNISVEDRLKFAEDLFELSYSDSKKSASAHIYHTWGVFEKTISEKEMYTTLFYKILNKLPKLSTAGHKNGKNNIIIFLDNNDVLDIKTLSRESAKILKTRNYFLIERCINFDSGNDTPGIIFADFIAYFIDNFFKTYKFNKENKEQIAELKSKLHNDTLTESEYGKLKTLIVSLEKEITSNKLLSVIKSIKFIK